jgi:NADH-quinone oxidoreductase subunit M
MSGILLGAVYMLWTMQRIYLGKLNEKWSSLPDLTGREYFMLIPLTIIIIFLGVYPSPMLNLMNASVNQMVKYLNEAQFVISGLNIF